MTTKDKVRAFIEQQNMLSQGDHLLVGLSGGADSVCLFYILQALAEEYDLKLTAVHVEHGIRGTEALKDADFVQKLCDKEGVSCHVEHADVPALALEEGLSEEEAGRRVRYEVFGRIAKQVGADKIAVAHHKNDVAETMLFHLCRGTGPAGLCALLPVRGNIIRPLLSLDREEIESYLAENHIEFCTDSTNADLAYTRNYLRREVLPRLEEVNPRVIDHLAQTSILFEGAKETLETVFSEKCYRYVKEKDEEAFLAQDLFEEENEYVITGVLQNVMAKLAGSKKDIHFKHMQSTLRLGSMQVGKRVDLPYGLVAVKEYEGVRLLKGELYKKRSVAKASLTEDDLQEICLQIPGTTVLGDGTTVETRIFSAEEIKDIEKIPDKKYTKWFDYDIINGYISLRHRQPGDYMVVDAAGGTKKLKDLLINEKVAQGFRDKLLLFTQDNLVLWAVGVRMGEFGKIQHNTKSILEIRVHGGKENE